MRRVVITGATGTIGRALAAALHERGDKPVALARDRRRAGEILGPAVEVHVWADPQHEAPPAGALAGAAGVVNLLGESVAQRWSASAKARIRGSRVESTRLLVAALRGLPDDQRPPVLVSQSATGFYGPCDDRELDERSAAGSDFLAGVVTAWEHEAQAAEEFTRVVRTRTGVVLTPSGGALGRMLPFFRLGIGGPVAGGRQYMPWIHLEDTVGAMLFCLAEPSVTGAVNLTTPHPVTNAEFSHALGRALHRPAGLPVPALALQLMYGEMAQIVTTGQRVLPRRLMELGYEFRHPDLEAALVDAVRRRRRP